MLVRPDYVIEHVSDMNLDDLWQLGVRGFIFDLDNTIMAPHTGLLNDREAAWLKLMQDKGFKSIVVSNNHLAEYTLAAEKVLNIPVLGNAKKPRRKTLRKAVEILGLQTHEIAVVGDRPLTDIWGGQRLGAKTILVDPLIKAQEIPLFKILRRLERLFIVPTRG